MHVSEMALHLSLTKFTFVIDHVSTSVIDHVSTSVIDHSLRKDNCARVGNGVTSVIDQVYICH